MWDTAFCELYTSKPQLISEKRIMTDKHQKQINKIFKKYYHTAIRKIITLMAFLTLTYIVMDAILHYQPSKITMIIIASIISLATMCILVFPLVRIHKIKQKKYKWYIGKVTDAREHNIFIDYERSTPICKKDYETANPNDIYILIWIKNKKYAINPHVSDASELIA